LGLNIGVWLCMGVGLCYQNHKTMALRTPAKNTALDGITGPVMVKNNIQSVSELKVKIVTSAQGAESNLLIFQGPTPVWLGTKFGCTICDQVETVLSSSISAGTAGGFAEFNKYIEQNGLYITYIRMITSTTSIYDGSLWIGEMPPNGIANPEEINLSPYATVLGGGGYDKTLLIKDRAFSNTRNFFMYLSSMPASATLDITFGVAAIGNTFAAEKV